MADSTSDSNGSEYAIVLAAGASTRMGTCKASLPWHDSQTLLTYQLSQLLLATITPVVVVGTHNAYLQETCPAYVQVVVNPDTTRGKISSILTGLAVLPTQLQTLIISAVDQPRSTTIYTQLLQAHRQSTAPITLPVYGDRRGHPLLLSGELRSELLALSEQTLGLRQLVQQYSAQLQLVEFQTPEVLLDLNTPEEYHHSIVKQAVVYSKANTSATT
ncbi:nucleotidyltransferase family protein [Thermocoleostomius sinensis]|uniref:Nucleotidyltransferase family protein n=1 Tax=Thermocoleostomius sinensis A174 TaxID=2016057 RepID=A0A9E9CBJ0_9CYAN|nr:nucleotidyltransferase family protein [Thermocoleostomius sinensis]WAL62447.1 nucleotidyltransferase family protein [Thermocoleostomius sinensis A174]